MTPKNQTFLPSLFFIGVLAACSPPTSQTDAPDPTRNEITNNEPQRPDKLNGYEILKDETFTTVKRSVDVRLPKKVSESDLNAFAVNIRDRSAIKYNKTFILYYLPDMEIGAGAWATSHFTPELDVRILGLTKEEEKSNQDKLNVKDKNIIGVWLDERPYVGATISIYEQNELTLIKTIYKDGSGSTKNLRKKSDPQGTKFEDVDTNTFGEYWILSPDGNLRIYDKDGLILKYKKSKN